MKKLLLLLTLMMMLSPWAANAQESIPFSEGFETMSNANDLTTAGWIWYRTNTESSLSIETSDNYVYTGDQALLINNFYAESTDYVVLGLPLFNTAINYLQITFAFKALTGTVEVGYLTNADDASTFVSMASYAHSSSYVNKTTELGEAPANAARIAIKFVGNSRCYLDDILVETIPLCRPATSLTVSDITCNSALVSWEGEGDTWNLQYKKYNESTWTEINGLTSKSYNLTDLTSKMTYHVRVQNVCEDGFTTQWINEGFNTIASLPFVEQFNASDIPFLWHQHSGLLSDILEGHSWGPITYTKWYFGTHSNVFDSHARLQISGGSCHNWLMTPTMRLDSDVLLCFDIALRTPSGNIPSNVGIDDKFIVLITTDGGSTWSILRQWDCDEPYEFYKISYSSTGETVMIDLSNYAGQDIAVAFYGESTETNFSTMLHLDNVIIGHTKQFVGGTNNRWDVADNWSPTGVPTQDHFAVIGTPVVIPDGCVAVADGAIRKNANATVTIEDGGQFQYNGTGLVATVEKTISGYGENPGGYCLISNPVVDDQAATTAGLVTSDVPFDLYYFDQSQPLEWINYEDYGNTFTHLIHQKGYLYATQSDADLRFTGELNPTNSDIPVTLDYVSSAEFPGFNLIGNPFTCNAYFADENGRDFYVITDGEEGSEIQLAAEETVIESMQGVFVVANQENETATFTTTPLNLGSKSIDLRLSDACGNPIDMARVRFGQGNNLRKMQLNSNHTKVYLPQGNDDFAVAFTESPQGELPINFKAEKNGLYTLTIPPLTSQLSPLNFTYLHLIDNLTGNDVDLLETPNYTFEARYTDYASRFKLVFMADEGAGEAACVPFAFISDGHIIVNTDAHGATLQMVDMMGRVIQSHNGDAMNRVSTVGMAPGVYVLRLVNGDDIKTQKIVIE